MGGAKSISFNWADAWLLHSVILAARDGSALFQDIVAAGDVINHAIFTYAEMSGGLAKLASAGYVRLDRDRVWLAESGCRLAQVLGEQRRSISHDGELIERHLGATPWSKDHDPGFLDPRWTTPELTKDAFDQACSSYEREARQAMRKMN